MKLKAVLFLVAIILSLSSITFAKTYEFKNGNWFNGKTFKKKTFYSVNGIFSRKKPKMIDESVDLKNQFVIPPFGEAHNHSIDNKFTVKPVIKKYLDNGIFYIKNPNSILRFTKEVRPMVNRPETVDVIFSHGGLTAKGGHPIPLYSRIIEGGLKQVGINDVSELENDSYYIINNAKEFEKKWSMIKKENPDFIKTYLLYSEEYEKRKDSKNQFEGKGLNPKLLPKIVKKAHADGLRVTTHIETAYDFKMAVAAGVDEINHLPAYYASKWRKSFAPYKLNKEDAKLAAKKGVFVVPTYSLAEMFEKDSETIKKTQEVQKANLKILQKAGVKITIGCDDYMKTSKKEALYLKRLGVFSNLELLKMWTENTPQTIFPKRKITKLKKGYEASFIALEKNPLENFEAVKDIKYRFKQGVPIN